MANVSIPKPNHSKLEIVVVGDSPLLTNRFSDKARDAILDKQQKKAKGGKGKRDPEAEFRSGIYRVDQKSQEDDPREVDPDSGTFGLPAVAFKRAIQNMAKDESVNIYGTTINRGMHVMGDIVPINYDKLACNESLVTIGRGGNDLRFRPEFKGWSAKIMIRFDADIISAEQIVNLLNRAGFSVGVGDWRPQCGGSYGMFHVEGCE